jgi:Tol biopolymer transport system component
LDIYRIPDNTQNNVEQLTFTPTIGEYGLLVSPNGDRIVFDTEFYASSEMEPAELAIEKLRHVYLLDTASKKLIDITHVLETEYEQVGHDFFRDWSPDQKQFMLVNREVADSEVKSFLEFVDLDGKNGHAILIPTTGEIPALIYTAEWSPDAKKVLLTQGVIGIERQQQYPGSAILVYDLGSGNLMQITNYEDHCIPVQWSPTSRQIVATCSYVPPYSIAVGVSGPETVRILDAENPGQPYERVGFSPCDDPAWSPDGKQIAFVCDKGTKQAGLFIANADGNGIREVPLGNLENLVVLKDPTWSPDGTQIVYVAGGAAGQTNIYAVGLNGANNHALTNQDAFYNIVVVYPLP